MMKDIEQLYAQFAELLPPAFTIQDLDVFWQDYMLNYSTLTPQEYWSVND